MSCLYGCHPWRCVGAKRVQHALSLATAMYMCVATSRIRNGTQNPGRGNISCAAAKALSKKVYIDSSRT